MRKKEVEFGRHIASIIIGHTCCAEIEIEEDEIFDFVSSDSDSEHDFSDFDLSDDEVAMEIKNEVYKEESLSEPEASENCEPMVIFFYQKHESCA